MPVNYQYPLSAVIYKVIKKADAAFAGFLHDTGYGKGHKTFKLFTFSDIITPFKMVGDRMQLLSKKAEVNICFCLPAAAENFIKGLFLDQEIEIADRKSRVNFHVIQIESIADNISKEENPTVILQPLSPIVTGIKNEKGNYSYFDPRDPDFTGCLVYNCLQKYKAIYDADENSLQLLKDQIGIKMMFFSNPPQQRLITIKAGTNEETKIKGFKKFRIEATAPKELLEIALGAGLGLYNAQGMGCVEVVK